jgi:hypothetical protein
MKQTKLKRKHTGFSLVLIITALVALPILADEGWHVTVTLQAPEPTSSGQFGHETELIKDGIVIGEWISDVEGIGSAGRAYIYDTDWKLKKTLQAPTPKETENFGRELDALGDIIVVGSPSANVGDARMAGKAYVFDSEGTFLTNLQSPDPMSQGAFGKGVAIGRDNILVAEIGGVVEGLLNAGSVHVYSHEGVLIRSVTSPEMKSEGRFGRSMAVNDEFILVGEPGTPERGCPVDEGSVYVYDHDWNLVTTLHSPDMQERSFYGFSTSISGNYAVIGEIWATVDGNEKVGRAHLYDAGWNLVATLQSPTPDVNGEFGFDVKTGGDIVVVGERRGDVESMNEGKAYVFNLEGNLITTLVSPAPFPGNQFGHSVETDGEIIVVCEADVEAGGEPKAGKVHVFEKGTVPPDLTFIVENLTINPATVKKGETVTISVETKNIGKISGDYEVILTINGAVEDECTVTLGPDESISVDFDVVAGKAGKYSVDVNGLTDSFTVDGIPGFPIEFIVIGIAIAVLGLWLTQRQR